MATFAQLCSQASARLKDPDNISISAANVAAVINDAIQYWKKKRFYFNEFEETVTLNANDPILPALPNDVVPLYLFREDGIVINYAQTRWLVGKVSPAQYDAMNVQGRGIPYAYTYRNQQYELYRYPDAGYDAVVRGVKDYPILTSAPDTSNDFTEEAPNLILYEALSRLIAEFRQDPKMEEYYSNRALNEATALFKQTNRNNATGRMAVEGF